MATRHLTAKCRSCGAVVELEAVAAAADGRCPGCDQPYSPEWTVLLVEECAAAENLTQALVRSLRRLTGLPGNLELQPDHLFANLRDEVPWHQSIETDPAPIAAEIERISKLLDHTELSPEIAAEISTLAADLAGLATMLDANQEATDPANSGAGSAVRSAALGLDSEIRRRTEDSVDDEALRRRLREAAASM